MHPYDLGVKALKRGSYDNAIGHFEAAIVLDPDDAISYCAVGMVGQLFDTAEDRLAAYSDFRVSLLLEPDLHFARETLEDLLRKSRECHLTDQFTLLDVLRHEDVARFGYRRAVAEFASNYLATRVQTMNRPVLVVDSRYVFLSLPKFEESTLRSNRVILYGDLAELFDDPEIEETSDLLVLPVNPFVIYEFGEYDFDDVHLIDIAKEEPFVERVYVH